VNRRESFEGMVKWLGEARERCDPRIPMILVGNKIDQEMKYFS